MIGILVMTVLAFILSILLVLISSKTETKNDYLKYLPGYNCGTCGFGSCKGMSEAMEQDLENYKKCKLLKGEALKKIEEMVALKKSE